MNSFFDLKNLEKIFLSLKMRVSTLGHLNKKKKIQSLIYTSRERSKTRRIKFTK